MPFSVRCYILGLMAVAFATIVMLPFSQVDARLLLAMCALVVAAERSSRVKVGLGSGSMSVSLVVTIITVLVLPPPEAALLGLVTSLLVPRPNPWSWDKAIGNSAMLSLAPAAGAVVCYLTGGHQAGRFLNFPGFLWPFAAAVTACLAVNVLILASFMTLSGEVRFLDVARGALQRAAMMYYSSAVLALIFLALWNDIGWFTAPLVVVPMYIAHWSLLQYSREEAAHEGTIAALVQAVEIKDSYTRGHSERVARGAEMLARQLRMPQERVAMLRFAGLLHDIGKLGVPTRLLTSTGGLTEEEYKLLCMHPNHGVAVLRDIRFLTEVYEGVLYHHERLDGRGYPTGKAGDEIPEFARIIGVADAFDAMTSTRSYRAARSVQEAVTELRRGAGTQFDPVLVQAFEAALALAERAGRPWVPTELPVTAADGEAAAVADTGPWPLPKRVPGFSFADHDDPFVPAEWFSDWYPSWLADAWEGRDGEGPSGPYDWPQEWTYDGIHDVRGPGGPEGGIPAPRTGEPWPTAQDSADAPAAESDGSGGSGSSGESDPSGGSVADLDDGWSARMHSAVVREPGPDPDESWIGDGDPAPDDDTEEPPRGGPLRLRDVSQDASERVVERRLMPGSMRIRGVLPDEASRSAEGTGSSWFTRDSVSEPIERVELDRDDPAEPADGAAAVDPGERGDSSGLAADSDSSGRFEGSGSSESSAFLPSESFESFESCESFEPSESSEPGDARGSEGSAA